MLPTLGTPRLAVRPATSADLDDIWRLLTAPDVRRHLRDDVELPRHQAARMLDQALAARPSGFGWWLISFRRGDRLGCAGLQPLSSAMAACATHLAGDVEPWIALAPEHWGRGYAFETLAAILAYGFRARRLERIVALVDEPNAASHRLMGRLGFASAGSGTQPRYQMTCYELSPSSFEGRGPDRVGPRAEPSL